MYSSSHPNSDPDQPQSSPSSAPSYRVQLPTIKPIVTYAILALTVLIYLGQMITPQLVGFDLPVALGIKSNELIRAGQWWRLFTPMLLHGSIMHIGFNMYALYIIGPQLERFYGHARFLALYILGGFAGTVLSFALTDNNSLGASTAVFGLFAAQGVFMYHNRHLFGERSRAAIQQIIMLAAVNFIIGLSPGIDNWGHLGGFVAGAAFAWFAGPVWKVQGHPPALTVYDTRPQTRVVLAGVAVFVIFLWLALFVM